MCIEQTTVSRVGVWSGTRRLPVLIKMRLQKYKNYYEKRNYWMVFVVEAFISLEMYTFSRRNHVSLQS